MFGDGPAIIAHRGYGKGTVDGLLENTLPAFREALDRGVDWLEIDVRRSVDDDLFVLHHPTAADGEFLSDLTSEQVRAQGVLPLTDLLAGLPIGVGVVFDVKTSLEDALRPPAATTAGLLVKHLRAELAAGRRVMVTSFDPAVLILIGQRVPEVSRGLLTWLAFPLRKAIPAAAHLGLDAVSVHWKSFAANTTDPAPHHRETAYSVDVAHRAGLAVIAWCPGVEDGTRLLAAGVDALIVDDIPGALSLRTHGP